MTMLVSVVGLIARFAGALLTTALGWASTLLFGRVPRAHQVFVVLMLAGAIVWIVLLAGVIAPGIPDVILGITPHPPFIDRSAVRAAFLVGLASVPLGVGFAAYLVPADGERPSRLALIRELLRGYLLTPILAAIMLFLPAVGISRKARSIRHGWADAHVPIVAKPGGYDQIVSDLQRALASAGVPVEAEDEPAVLSLPAWLLTSVAGGTVRKLRPDRLVELSGPKLRIGVYPSDIAISGPTPERDRARAAIVSRLATTAAHLTTSAEAQAFEDRLEAVAGRHRSAGPGDPAAVSAEFEPLDVSLLGLAISTDEWDILYRLRLQMERDILIGAEPGTEFPTDRAAESRSAATKGGLIPAPVASGRLSVGPEA